MGPRPHTGVGELTVIPDRLAGFKGRGSESRKGEERGSSLQPLSGSATARPAG